jgi:hypothetical protein
VGRYLIIGAGAAGLSALQAMKRAGHETLCIEKSDRVGGHWNTDYDALHLITARDQTHFPDYPMPATYPHFPSRAQVADYIHAFAEHEQLTERITFDTEVLAITPLPVEGGEPLGSRGWNVTTTRGDEGDFDGVIVANGHLWDPRVPAQSRQYTGRQVHTSQYKNTADLADGSVLVVGAGNSGCDVAVDVAQGRIPVDIVIRKGIHFQPKMYFGMPRQLVPFLKDFTPAEQDLLSRLMARVSIGENSAYPGLPDPQSHDLAGGATTVNDLLLYWIQHGRITVRPGIERIEGTTVHFDDGSTGEYGSVIWATGFNVRLPFLDSEHLAWRDGTPVRYAGGILPEGAENLYFVGLIAPRGPQIPVYGEQMRRILRMLALKEGDRSRPFHLAAYFAQVQEPETRIDVVRADWDRSMVETDTHLDSLSSLSVLEGAR